MGTPGSAWTRQIGTTSFETGQAISADTSGGVVITGSAFILGNGTRSSSFEILLAKFDREGNLDWITFDGSSGNDLAHAVTTANDGDVFITGQTDGGLHGNINAGSSDAFLSRYSRTGDLISSTLLGSSGKDIGYAITRSADGSIYVAGSTNGNLAGQLNRGGSDGFVSRYNSDGQLTWVRLVGGQGNDSALAITSDAHGSIFVAGLQTDEQRPGFTDAFISRLDLNGNLLWSRSLGSNGQVQAKALSINTNGDVVVAGYGNGLPGTAKDAAEQEDDLFIASFKPDDGTPNWIKTLGTSSNDTAEGLSTGPGGLIVLAASTNGSLREDAKTGSSDVAMFAFNSAGEELWRTQIGTDAADYAADITTTSDGLFVLTGSSNGPFNNQLHSGTRDVIIHSFGVTTPPPQDILLSGLETEENVSTESAIASLTVSNASQTGAISFSLTSGEGDADNSAFNIFGSELRFNVSPNYELKKNYNIRLRATNAGGLFSEKNVAIKVTDRNEAPSSITASSSQIPEDKRTKSIVTILNCSDPDNNNQPVFTLVHGTGDTHNSLFSINGKQLILESPLDHEQLNTLQIRVRATDQGGLYVDQVLTLDVTDENEDPKDILISQTGFNATAQPFTPLLSFTTVDPDEGDTFSYSLATGEGSGNNNLFTINGKDLLLREALPVDQTKALVRVRSTDRSGNSVTRVFSLGINQTPTAIKLSDQTLNENIPAGSSVAILSATDANFNDGFQYELVNGEGDQDNSVFSIRSDKLYINRSPDFEKKATYSIRVRATDSGGLAKEEKYVLEVRNLEELTELSANTSVFNENIAANSLVATLRANHPNKNLVFSLSFATGDGDAHNQAFSLSGNQLYIKAQPNHEIQNTYFLRIRATDQLGASSEHELVFRTTDQNEAPTAITASSPVVNLGAPAKSSVATLRTNDPDFNDRFTFSLVNGSGSLDNNLFLIDDQQLKLKTNLGNAKNNYSVRVRATDQGGLSTTQILTFRLNRPPTQLTLSSLNVQENQPELSTVATLSVDDPDRSDIHRFTLVLGDGDSDNNAFIVQDQRLILIKPADYESKNRYLIRLRATDPHGESIDKGVTVTVANQLEAPEIYISHNRFNQTLSPGGSIGQLWVSDLPNDTSINYRLVSESGHTDDNSLFEIAGSSLLLRSDVSQSTKTDYKIRIQANTSTGVALERQFALTLNHAPADIWTSDQSISGTVPAGSTVAYLMAADANEDDEITYTLISQDKANIPGNNDHIYFRIEGNRLIISESPLNHNQDSYQLNIRASDQGGLSSTKELTFNRIAAPRTIFATSSIVQESEATEVLVGALLTDAITEYDNPVFSLTGGIGDGDNNKFRINNGQLTLIPSADYEQQNTYSIRVKAEFSNGFELQQQLLFRVNDGKDKPLGIVASTNEFTESVAPGSTIATLSAVDPDAGDSHTFSLAGRFDGNNDNVDFSIDGNKLIFKGSADFEARSEYAVLVKATDITGLYHEQLIQFRLNDVNESPLDIYASVNTFEENVPPLSVVAELSTSDPDINDVVRFELAPSASSNDNHLFSIEGNKLRIKSSPDFEVKQQFQLRIRGTDQGGLSVDRTLQFSVKNINEAPALISLSSTLIGHAAQAGTVAAVLTTADPDAGDIFKYSLVTEEKDGQVFSIRGDKLILNQDANALSKSEYSVVIVSTDQAGLSRSQSFLISVQQAPTVITASRQSISESAAIGEAVAQLSLQGPLGDRQYSFSITDELGTLDSSHFTISGSQLILRKALDFESSSTITLSLRATDTAGNRLENQIALDVIDANEAPSEILLNNNTIKESVAPKALVANLSATDPDQADSHSFTLPNVEKTDNHLFYLQRNQLRIREQPDYEAKPVYKLILRATDQSGVSLEQEKLILVEDINESPIDIEITSNTVSELMPAGSTVGILRTVDPDKNDLFSYSLVAGIGSQDNSSFYIDSDRLRFNDIGDYETKGTYSIRLRSTDKGGVFVEKELLVHISNINESPTNLRSSTDELFRETMPGTIVARFLADDPDQIDELTYQLVQGEGSRDNGLFSVEANTLKLRSTIGDRDQKELSIRVRASDKAGSFTEQKFSFSLPAVIISSTSAFAETTRMGSIISTLTVSGYSQSRDYVISLNTSNVNNDNALFSINGNTLALATNADHERKDSYVISVVAESPNGDTLQRNLEILVADVNEAPTNLVISANQIDNTALAGAVIANIAADDPDRRDSLKFSIVSVNGENAAGAFGIVDNKLILQKAAQDLGTRNVSILLRAVDSAGLMTEKSFDLQVVPKLLLSSLEISEDLEVGSSISVLSTTSTAPNEKYKYALASDGSSNDNHLFYIEGDQLKVRFAPDFESKSSYRVKIVAANETGVSISSQFDLRVIETNMSPAFLAVSTNQFEEGKPANSVVTELIALDPNANDQIIYQLAIGNGGDDNSFFSISDNKLVINSLANFEAKPSYSVRIKAIDQGGLSIEESFKINIVDRNDAPTAISPSTRYININAPSRSVVATLATIDEDQKDQHAYSLVTGLGSDDNHLFTVSGNSLRINGNAAASKKDYFNVRISSRDSENAAVEEALSFAINRGPTGLGISSNVFDENQPTSYSLLSFSTADPDKSDSFTYEFTPGVGAKDNDKFIINGNQLRAKGVVDYESQSTYSIRVRSTDQGGLSTVQVFELAVKDVNEPPGLIVASQNSFVENIPQKTIVATLQSVDPEDAGLISFSLVAGVGDKDNRSFTILGNTLLINTSVDYERQKTYSVRIEAKDIDEKASSAVLNLSVVNVVESVDSSISFDLPQALDKLILTGSLDINGKGNGADNEIIGNAGHNVLTGAGGKDTLTGLTGSDVFSYPKLADSLIAFFDRITDFEMGIDKLDVPSPVSNSSLYYAGLLSSLNPELLMSSFTSTRLPANTTGFLEVLEPLPTGLRTFIVVNDSIAGYQSDLDAVIEITGYRGDLQNLLFV
jgi:hypothetical protein